MPPEKSWWEVKNRKLEGKYFFDGKLPGNAWHRMRQLCVQLHTPIFSLLSALYFRGGGRLAGSNPPPGIFKVNVKIQHTTVNFFLCSLGLQIFCTSSFEFFPPPLGLFALII